MDPTEEDLSSCSWWLIYSEGYRKRQSSSSYEEAKIMLRYIYDDDEWAPKKVARNKDTGSADGCANIARRRALCCRHGGKRLLAEKDVQITCTMEEFALGMEQ